MSDLSEEEKQAIEILNTFIFREKTKNYNKLSLEDTESVKIVLNLIEKQQNEIEKMKTLIKLNELNEVYILLNAKTEECENIRIERDKALKVIDRMAETLEELLGDE